MSGQGKPHCTSGAILTPGGDGFPRQRLYFLQWHSGASRGRVAGNAPLAASPAPALSLPVLLSGYPFMSPPRSDCVRAANGGLTCPTYLAVAPPFSAALIGAVIFSVAVALIAVLLGVLRLWSQRREHQLHGILLLFSVILMILVCAIAPMLLSRFAYWRIVGPLLLFVGLLTLLNAPFDWTSLGLTRALMRRGLELRSWCPYALALLDAVIASVVIAVLTLTMVIGVQAFDASAVRGGGAPVLPLEPLFNGIAANPSAPEYWWIYALLLSTMIPSLVNLMIGGASLVRGLPGLPSLLLRKIPAQGNVPKFRPRLDRHCPYLPGRCWCGLGYPPPRSFWSW